MTNVVARVGDVQGACEVRVTCARSRDSSCARPRRWFASATRSSFVVTAFGPDGQAIPDVAATFQSSDPAVATVDASGVATGHKAGAATISVELAGATAEASLLVN